MEITFNSADQRGRNATQNLWFKDILISQSENSLTAISTPEPLTHWPRGGGGGGGVCVCVWGGGGGGD